MTPREYWSAYVEQSGGTAALALRAGIPYSTLQSVTNGSRGIGKALARKLKASDPLVDEKQLVWVAPVAANEGEGV